MSIVVIGSINTDLTIRVPRFAKPDETILGSGSYAVSQGGKGANQAVAATAAGLPVRMIGKVGTDAFGAAAIDNLVAAGVNCDSVARAPDHSTGLAAIFLDPDGSNSITVAPGANAQITPADIESLRDILNSAKVVMLQLEIPLDAVRSAAKLASECGALVLLDPAPAPADGLDFLEFVDYLTPNEVEAESLTGIAIDSPDGPKRIAEKLLGMGARNVVLTLGARGSYLANATLKKLIRARKVSVVDTTGAGDSFSGYLATALAKGFEFVEAAEIASAAAALSVTGEGARANQSGWDAVMGFVGS